MWTTLLPIVHWPLSFCPECLCLTFVTPGAIICSALSNKADSVCLTLRCWNKVSLPPPPDVCNSCGRIRGSRDDLPRGTEGLGIYGGRRSPLTPHPLHFMSQRWTDSLVLQSLPTLRGPLRVHFLPLFFLDPSCVTSLWTVHGLSQGGNEDVIVVSAGWRMHPGTFCDSPLVFMICHLEAAIWRSGTPSGIDSGWAPRKVSGMDATGELPKADVCVRRGCGQRTGQQLCNNRSALCRENVLCNSHLRIFFPFLFRAALLNREIHAACVFQVLAAVKLRFLHRSFSRGDVTREQRAVSNFTSCTNCCWESFATQWESCPPISHQHRELKSDPLVRVAGNILYD